MGAPSKDRKAGGKNKRGRERNTNKLIIGKTKWKKKNIRRKSKRKTKFISICKSFNFFYLCMLSRNWNRSIIPIVLISKNYH